MSLPHLYALGYLWVLWFAGYVLFCAIAGRCQRHPMEILGLSGLLGGAAVPMLLFWFSLAGIAPNRVLLGGIFTFSLAALCWFIRLGRLVLPTWWWPRLKLANLWLMPFGLMVGWVLWTAATQTLRFELIDWDGFATWGFRAKALYLDALPNLHDHFHDLTLSFATQDHPLLLPFLTAGSYAAMGGVYDTVGKIAVLFLFCSYTFFLYGALRSLLSRAFALVVTAIAIGAPAVLRWGLQGTPDMPLAAFYAVSLYFVVAWLGGGPRRDLWLAGFFSAACVFTKNEGVPLAAINFLAVAAGGWKRQPRFFRDLAMVTVVCALSLLPWALFRHTLPHTNENYAAQLTWTNLTTNENRLPVIFAFFLARMFFDANWSPVWFLVFGMFFAVDWTRPCWQARLLLLLLLAHWAAYVVIYMVTPYSLSALFAETLDRLYLHILPAGIWLLAFSLAQILLPAASSSPRQLEPET